MPLLRRLLVSSIISTFIAIGGLMTLLLHPLPLFSHQQTFGPCTVYSMAPVDVQWEEHIEQAIALISRSSIYDSTYKYDIILAHNTWYNALDNKALDDWAAARAIDNNIVIKAPVNITEGYAQTPQSNIDLTYMLAHEMIHCLQAHTFGRWTFNPFHHPPLWKLEGYPELIARAHQLSSEPEALAKEIRRYQELRTIHDENWLEVVPNNFVPDVYFRGRLLTNYLIQIEGYSYTDILQDTTLEDIHWQAAVRWSEE